MYLCTFVGNVCISLRNCGLDVTVHLQVQSFGALEGVVFISYGHALAEYTGVLFSGSLGVSSQFDVQSMVGASEL